MVFLQPGSNVLGSRLQPLLGLAHGHGGSGPTQALPYRLQLAFVRPGRIAPDPGLLSKTHDAPHCVPGRACRSSYGPNLLAGQPPADHLIDIRQSHLPVCHLQALLRGLGGIPVRSKAIGGWVNDPENVGESW
ncbi:MAG TPA: hypothetical protein VNB49_13165 [Candidatus Dormibacteraeota bacterium]|nr:hypothetical protein [Candidatus Dormibacteraeota bacterium]